MRAIAFLVTFVVLASLALAVPASACAPGDAMAPPVAGALPADGVGLLALAPDHCGGGPADHGGSQPCCAGAMGACVPALEAVLPVLPLVFDQRGKAPSAHTARLVVRPAPGDPPPPKPAVLGI